jgi:hypothetical protein
MADDTTPEGQQLGLLAFVDSSIRRNGLAVVILCAFAVWIVRQDQLDRLERTANLATLQQLVSAIQSIDRRLELLERAK